MGVDRLKAAALRAARAIKARLARIDRRAQTLREVPGTGAPGWMRSTGAEVVYAATYTSNGPTRRPFMWARLSGRCECCGATSTHTCSTADIRENAEVIRCLCRSCALAVALASRRQ